MNRHADRIARLRSSLVEEGLDALLVSSFVNVTYLTGFTGDDSYLLVTRDGQVLLSDFRYVQQLQEECPWLDVESRTPGTTLVDVLGDVVTKAKLSKIGVEANSLSLHTHQQIVEKCKAATFPATDGLVERLREIKDEGEIAEIREAIRLAERAFAVLRASLRPEQSEREIAAQLEHQIRMFGGTGCSFTPIIAVGDRAALPHYRPGQRRVAEHPLLLVDWGACGRLYRSDLTRVLVTGNIPPKLEAVYGVVLKAQLAGIAAIRPGAVLEEVDAAARRTIAAAGFGERFGHSLGHGIGMQVHEAPRLAVNQKKTLQPGMVVTVEPGIYIPEWGGVRIEDDVLVTPDGCEVLSHVPKDFSDCVVTL